MKTTKRTLRGYLADFNPEAQAVLMEAAKNTFNKYYKPEEGETLTMDELFQEMLDTEPLPFARDNYVQVMANIINVEFFTDEITDIIDNDESYTEEAKRTVGSYIEQIKDKKLRETIVDHASEWGTLERRFYGSSERNPATALLAAFPFNETPEGSDYWFNVVEQLENQE